MTIDSAYWPEKRNNHGGTVYQFEFEIIDPAYIEVYAIDAGGVYTLIDPADYTVTIGTFIAPISRGGRVTFGDPLDASVVAISIQRKTDVTDEQEFTTGQPFNAESFEFQCDKLTMVLQEINGSVCDCSDITKRYCDVYACNAYAQALIDSSATGVWLMTQGTGGLTVGSPVQAERAAFPMLVASNSISSTTLDGILPDRCVGDKRYNLGSSGLGRVKSIGYGGDGLSSGMKFGMTALVLNNNSQNGTVFFVRYANNNSVQFSAQTGVSGPASQLRIVIQSGATGHGAQNFTFDNYWQDFPFVMGISFKDGELTVYKNWEVVGAATPLPISSAVSVSDRYVEHVFSNLSHYALWGDVIPEGDVAALKYGLERNYAAFADPDPNCVPPA